MNAVAPMVRSPYRGLAPFGDSEVDAQLFLGRERETEIVTANLMASRLTVLYGASGVGKSSLLRAGVARRLREDDALGQGRHIVVVSSTWTGDPQTTLSDAIEQELARSRTETFDHVTEHLLVDQLERWCDALDGEIYVVLDQLEEYVLYHGNDRGGPLAEALAEIVTRPDLRVGVLLAVRDDALAQLDAFKGRVPSLYSNVLRLDHLSRPAGRQAIVGPLEAFALQAQTAPVKTEPELVEAVLDEVTAGRITTAEGRGLLPEVSMTGRIEAPYLQLVMARLWEVETGRGSDTLRASTLGELGGAARIVEEHLERSLSSFTPAERDMAASVFGFLVTPSGTKIAHSPGDLAGYVRVGEAKLRPVLQRLAGERVLRTVADGQGTAQRYEIFHDVLADAVLSWRAGHDADRLVERERAEARRRIRRFAALAGGALLALIAVGALAAWALSARADARDQTRDAKAYELEARAVSLLPIDSGLALALAAEAASLSGGPSAEEILRKALLIDRLEQVIPVGAPITDIAFEPRPFGRPLLIAGTADGRSLLYGSKRVGWASPVVTRHAGPVTRVTPDRFGMWSASVDGTAHRTILPSRRGSGSKEVVLRHQKAVVAVQSDGIACRDGLDCVVSAAGRELSIWDAPTGRPTGTIGTSARIEEVVVLRSGRLALRSADSVIRIVDIRRARIIKRLDAGQHVESIAGHPRRDVVAVGLGDGSVRVWSTATGLLLAGFDAHTRRITDLDLAGDLLLTGSADGTVTVWNLPTGKPVPLPGGHTNVVRAVELSSDARFAVTASADGTAKVWETAKGRLVSLLSGHSDDVVDATFFDRAARVATGSRDGTIRIWDSGTRPDLEPVKTPAPTGPVQAAHSSSGVRAVVVGDTVRLGTSAGASVILRGHGDVVNSVSFSPDGARVVTASRDHDARIWDAHSGDLVQVLGGRHVGSVADARFSPDGRWVVTAGPISAGLWDARTGAFVTYLYGPTSNLTAARFGPGSRTIVTAERNGTVRRYRCVVCGSAPELLAAAERRMRKSGRVLSDEERGRYLR